MARVFVRHRVKDYDQWKPVFDEVVDLRRAHGEKSYQIYHPQDDLNNLYLLFEWDNIANAKTYFHSDELKQAMEKAGVQGEPEITFLDENEEGIL